MTNPYIEWLDENQFVQRIDIIDRLSIGRTCKGIADNKRILIQGLSVSRDHAVIQRSTTHFQIVDYSKNGTWVNGIRMAAGSSKNLNSGDLINIGGVSFKLIIPEDIFTSMDVVQPTESTAVISIEQTVTSLVADVRGFTEFSRRNTSSSVFNIIKEIFASFSNIINASKGTVKDFAGDAIFAYWHHQAEPQREQTVLACKAAIQQVHAIQEIQARLSEETGVERLKMGWGVTTGKVTISNYGSRASDLALVGDCINLAFRFSGLGNKVLPEKIIVCSQTAALVGSSLSVKDLGEISVKGRKYSQRIFTVR